MTTSHNAFDVAVRVLAVATDPHRAADILDGDELDLITILLDDALRPERRFTVDRLGLYAAAAASAGIDTGDGTDLLSKLLTADDGPVVEAGSVLEQLLDVIGVTR